jgi:hypothetical protein
MSAQLSMIQKPTIAILTVPHDKRLIRGNRHNFIDLIRIGKTFGAEVYVITTSDLKLSAKKWHGYKYTFHNKKWSKQWLPAPQVIYNRIPYRKLEMKPEVQQMIQSCCRSHHVKLFNPMFFNKWTLFEWLNQSKHTRKYIPVTQLLSNSTDLERLLKEHSVIFLKPVRGKAGRGIMRVERKLQSKHLIEYRLYAQEHTFMRMTTHKTIESLWRDVIEHRGNKEYIMQQGIPLTHFKKRIYDLRALIQKKVDGKWGVTGIGARVAGKLSITTHVPRGGSIDDPKKLLTSGFGREKALKILRRTQKVALILAKQIEKSSKQQLGEMSMDLGVDTAGRIWFFEANSKPMKFDEPHIRQKSLARIIQYGIYMTQKVKRR